MERGRVLGPAPQETEPLRTEEKILAGFGYGDSLDEPVLGADGSVATGLDGEVVTRRRFLDVYSDPELRAHTTDILEGYLGMEPGDPDRADAEEYIRVHLDAFLGAPGSTN
jgi:hypothetical protein